MADPGLRHTSLTKTTTKEEESFNSESYYVKFGLLLVSSIYGTMKLMHYAPNYPFLGYPSEGYLYEKERWGEDNDVAQSGTEKSKGSILKKFERLIPVIKAILASDRLTDLLSDDFQFTTVDKILDDLDSFVGNMRDYIYKIEMLKSRKDKLFTPDEIREGRDRVEDEKDQKMLDTLAMIKKKLTSPGPTSSPSSSTSTTSGGSSDLLLMMDPILGLMNIPNTPIIATALTNMSTADMEVLDALFSLTVKDSLPWTDDQFGLLTLRDLTYKEDNFRTLVNQFLALQDIIRLKLTDLNQENEEPPSSSTSRRPQKPKKPPKCIVQSTLATIGPIVGFCTKHY